MEELGAADRATSPLGSQALPAPDKEDFPGIDSVGLTAADIAPIAGGHQVRWIVVLGVVVEMVGT